MVIAATLAMIICMTFRIPRAFQGTVYALIISRKIFEPLCNQQE